MSYLKIPNLYREDRILAFKRGYALEKVHGTSAHIKYTKEPAVFVDDGGTTVPHEETPARDWLRFFSGGASYEQFTALFDADALLGGFIELTAGDVVADIVVYGEAYGGKMQGMGKTYGPDLRFIAFEVKWGCNWLDVKSAADVCEQLGLEFVPYREIEFTQEAIDAERDRPSEVAVLRLGPDALPMKREGIVLRPPYEVVLNNGSRVIAKHKGADFCETKSKREADPDKRVLIEEADAVAEEWVTKMRLMHVLDKFVGPMTIDLTGEVIRAIIDDVMIEAGEQVPDTKQVRKAIGTKAASLFHEFLKGGHDGWAA